MTCAPIKRLTPENYLRPNHFLSLSFDFLFTSCINNQYSVMETYNLECVSGGGAVGSNMYALWDGRRSDRCKKVISIKKMK